MLYILSFIFLLFGTLQANPSLETSLEGLPFADTDAQSSTLIGGCVNVLTGSYVAPRNDWTLPGAEPLSLVRMYTHKHYFLTGLHSCWRHNFYSSALFSYAQKGEHRLYHIYLTQFLSPTGNLTLYDTLTNGEDLPEKVRSPFASREKNYYGLTNIGTGLISGQTNIKNNHSKFDSSKENLTIATGSGHRYLLKKCFSKKNKTASANKAIYGDKLYKFLIEKEIKPNGNCLLYSYDNEWNLNEVQSTNAAGDLLFGSFSFTHATREELKQDPELTITGSDGRKIIYNFERFDLKNEMMSKQFFISSVSRPEQPIERYEYVKNEDKSFCLLSRICHPEGRFLELEYYKEGDRWSIDKVKSIHAPSGIGDGKETLYTFSYHAPHTGKEIAKTEVIDAYGQRTVFHYNLEPRIGQIHRFNRKNALYSKDVYYWGAEEDRGNLLSQTFEDGSGKIHRCQSFIYDNRGNAIEEQLWGNLTGTNNISISMRQSYPKANGAECYTIKREYSNNGYNLLLKENQPNGKEVEYKYKSNSNLLLAKFVKGSGHQIREFYSYDENALQIKKIQDDGNGKSENDLSGVTQRLITYTIPNLKGGGIGLPKEIKESYLDIPSKTEKLLHRILFTYDPYGHLIKKELFDSQNQITMTLTWEYDSQGNVVKEQNSAGQSIEYKYDANKNRIYAKGPHPHVETHYFYDNANRCIKKEENHDSERFIQSYQYDVLGRMEKATDPFGQETQFTYDCFGRLIKKEFPQTLDEQGNFIVPIESYTYDLLGNKSSHTDAKGFKTSYSYTIRGLPTLICYPDGTQEKFEYTLEGHLAKKWEKNGTVVHYSYDAFGRKLTEKKYDKNRLISQESWDYNALHLLSHKDANGNITLYTYDGAGRKASEAHPAITDAVTQYIYDSCGRLWKTIQANTLVSVTEYDALSRPIEERTEDLQGTIYSKNQYQYDRSGNRIATIQYQEINTPRATFIKYDSHNQPIFITDPLGFKTHISYRYNFINKQGANVLQKITTDPNGIQTIETCNTHGSLASVIKRDPFGKLLSKEAIFYDPNGNATCWHESVVEQGVEKRVIINQKEFGSLNRIEKLVEAVGTPEQKITRYTYNQYGQLENLIKPDGTLLQSIYDSLGRLQSYHSSDQTIRYHYKYDNKHNLIAIEDLIQKSTTLRTYDALDRMIHETLGNSISLNYTYDPLSRKTAVQLPDGTSIYYTYAGPHLKEVIRCDQNNQERYRHCYQAHDLYGEATSIQLAKEVGQETRQFDPLGRRIATQSNGWEETVPDKGYDPVGNLLKLDISDNKGISHQNYAYDDLNQLTLEEGSHSHQFQYDSLNNCLEKDGKSRIHNALNQLLADSQNHYSYHPNGNLAQINGQENVYFEYDALDRLVTVVKGNTKAKYTYDHFHRRIKKETLVEGVSQQMQHYLYVDQDEIGSMEKGQITELRVLGEGEGAEIGSAIAIEVNGRILVPIHNMRGDLCCLIDSETKEIVQNCHYSAFGEPSAESIIPWGFSSKRLDPETGFIYFGRRYYSPSLGRWITPDPIGFRDGPNLYAYVHNSPLTHFDLYGLEAVSQLRDYRFNYSLSQYSPLNSQRWSSFGSNHNFRTPFAYDRFEYRSTNGGNYLTSAVKGCGHGALNFAVRSLQEFHRIGTHIGAEVMEASCHDKCNIFGSLERYQTNQLNVIGQYYRNIVSSSFVDPVYQSYRSGTELTLEIGTLSIGGYGAIREGLCLIRGLRSLNKIASFEKQLVSEFQTSKLNSENQIINIQKKILNWLGDETKMIKNQGGDTIFLSKNGTKRVRFDFNCPAPHENPHGHIEELINGKWNKSGPIYPIDVPHY